MSKEKTGAPEFIFDGRATWAIVQEVYQPKGFPTRYNKRGEPIRVLKQGRYIKKTTWLPLTKNYRNKTNEVSESDNSVGEVGKS